MKKIKLIIAGVAMLSFCSSAPVYADGFAPGEGLYAGIFGGSSMGIVQPKVKTVGNNTSISGSDNEHQGGTFEATDGGLGLEGFEGGGWLGYGYKMGAIYAGLEGEMAASDSKFKLTSDINITLSDTEQALTEVQAEKKWSGGLFGRLGFYPNADTLLSIRGGVLVSKFNVSTTGTTSYNENFYGGGPAFGVSLTSRVAALDPNLSIRMGAVYTDFLTASVFGIGTNKGAPGTASGHDSEVTGANLSARVGLTYSFFDVNSLF